MIDRRGNQLRNVLVCLHAVTIPHRGRATRSIDHDTHGHRLGQNKAQTGFERRWVLLFEGSQEARALALVDVYYYLRWRLRLEALGSSAGRKMLDG